MSFFKKPSLSHSTLIILVSLFFASVGNIAFFKHVLEIYPLSWEMAPFLASLCIVLVAVTVVVMELLSWRSATKGVLILIVILSALVAYFMDSYNAVIDIQMLDNAIQTDIKESVDLFSPMLLVYLFFMGLLPSWLIYKTPLRRVSWKQTFISKGKVIGVALLITVAVIFTFSKAYTSFFREHKPLRYYANPAYYLYSVGHFVQKSLSHPYAGLQVVGADATVSGDNAKRKLIVMVVGEAARWDHFSLNGYPRETNPLLKKEEIVNFNNFTSCGTETAVSVPCMFSSLTRDGYDKEKALHTENILDVLKRTGANVLWRDNNSDSKGVAQRIEFEDYKTTNNTMCEDGECRDEGMLVGLDEYIKAHPKGDIVIVLHQMGNHGPAYYKRYPKAFEKFTPVCRSNQLEQCTQEQIANAYDNAILYTDYFLSKTIGFLKGHDEEFETAMIYMSDHGESLGEKGLYLHGFPYAIAPEEQKHSATVMWFGKNFMIDKKELKKRSSQAYSHDFLFHTLLGAMEVKTTAYRPELDMLHGVH